MIVSRDDRGFCDMSDRTADELYEEAKAKRQAVDDAEKAEEDAAKALVREVRQKLEELGYDIGEPFKIGDKPSGKSNKPAVTWKGLTEGQRKDIFQMFDDGRTAKEIKAKYGASEASIGNWKRDYWKPQAS